MKITVLPRDYFRLRMGTPEETELLAGHRIISINASQGAAAMPPFSNLAHPFLLCLTFDDICSKMHGMIRFDSTHAARIFDFVKDDSMPLLIHCREGISRSGAVGEVLNYCFNLNSDDFSAFYHNNPRIVPNGWVRKTMLEIVDRKNCLPQGESWLRLQVARGILLQV